MKTKEQAKHTPGPWRADGYCIHHGNKQFTYLACVQDGTETEHSDKSITFAVAQANARRNRRLAGAFRSLQGSAGI